MTCVSLDGLINRLASSILKWDEGFVAMCSIIFDQNSISRLWEGQCCSKQYRCNLGISQTHGKYSRMRNFKVSELEEI